MRLQQITDFAIEILPCQNELIYKPTPPQYRKQSLHCGGILTARTVWTGTFPIYVMSGKNVTAVDKHGQLG